jgi:hypothetical protein
MTFGSALLVAVLTALVAPARPAPVEPVEPVAPVGLTAAGATAGPPAVVVLHDWDRRRADAWARGDPSDLRALYTRGSVAGRHDRAMLRAWAARGLVVHDLRTQLLSVRELAHTETTWTLRVTDRLADGLAVGPGVRRPLPRDQATTRTLRLRRVDGTWLVASVRPG